MGFNAQEWLDSVEEAVRTIKADETLEQRRRELAFGGGATLHDVLVARTPDFDVMRPVDEIADYSEGRLRRLSIARGEVAEAMRVFEGMRSVGELEARAADVLELSHVHIMRRRDVADALALSLGSVQRAYQLGVEWLDAHGLAHAKAAVGAAEV